MTNLIDNSISLFDRALRSITTGTQVATRPCPSPNEEGAALDEKDKRHAAGLMRVNHAGEVCAQALYQGQALTAKLSHVRVEMENAADEEIDHLAWCEKRLQQLDSHTSKLNPLWYSMSFGIGASAGLVSDKVSLGFVAATEELVCEHLRKHLESLPAEDEASRTIIQQMLVDEEKHAHAAIDAGGMSFPKGIKHSMRAISGCMTYLSYRI